MIGDNVRREKVEGEDEDMEEGYKSNSNSPNNRKASQYDLPHREEGHGICDDLIFQGFSSDFCVCMLDIVNSTVVTT